MDVTVSAQATAEFEKGLASLVHGAKLNAKTVVKKESGEALKSLVRMTPPADKNRTNADIKLNVQSKLGMLSKTQNKFGKKLGGAKESSTGVKWYAASSDYLFGVARTSDMRESDVKSLLGVYYATKTVQKHARIVVGFRKRKGSRQKVAILTKVVTSAAKRKELVNLIQGHTGRLKAGWLGEMGVTWSRLKPTGGNQPPAWVTKHKSKARGKSYDFTDNGDKPRFVMTNFAVGVGNPKNKMDWICESVLSVRGKAMQKNALLFMNGKKQISDYAK